MALLVLGGAFYFSYYPACWSMPTMILTGTAAAASFGMINSIALIGGFIGPYAVGWLNGRTGGPTVPLLVLADCFPSASPGNPTVTLYGAPSCSHPTLLTQHSLRSLS